MFERWGRRWECIRGYDITRDASWFELRDVTDDKHGDIVLFAKRPDASGVLTVSQYRTGMNPEVVQWFTDEAEVAIPPFSSAPEKE